MATITTTLAAGSVASPYFLDLNITKQLCKKTAQTPTFVPAISLVSYAQIGTGQYEAIVNVQGIVTFQPCKSCKAISQTINQNIVIPFSSTASPSEVSITAGTPITKVMTSGCQCCSNMMICDIPLSLTVTTA